MNQNYRVSIRFDSDGYWVAENPELRGCIADGETPQEALSSLNEARKLWIESRASQGLDVPVPQDEPEFSGRFVLRLAKSMHRDLAYEAEREGVSLNTHISNILAGRNAGRESQRAQPFGVVSNILASSGDNESKSLAPAINDYTDVFLCSPQKQWLDLQSSQSPWSEYLQNTMGRSGLSYSPAQSVPIFRRVHEAKRKKEVLA